MARLQVGTADLRIEGVASPSTGTDAANMAYVDNRIADASSGDLITTTFATRADVEIVANIGKIIYVAPSADFAEEWYQLVSDGSGGVGRQYIEIAISKTLPAATDPLEQYRQGDLAYDDASDILYYVPTTGNYRIGSVAGLIDLSTDTNTDTLPAVQDSGTAEGTGIATFDFNNNLDVTVNGTTATINGPDSAINPFRAEDLPLTDGVYNLSATATQLIDPIITYDAVNPTASPNAGQIGFSVAGALGQPQRPSGITTGTNVDVRASTTIGGSSVTTTLDEVVVGSTLVLTDNAGITIRGTVFEIDTFTEDYQFALEHVVVSGTLADAGAYTLGAEGAEAYDWSLAVAGAAPAILAGTGTPVLATDITAEEVREVIDAEERGAVAAGVSVQSTDGTSFTFSRGADTNIDSIINITFTTVELAQDFLDYLGATGRNFIRTNHDIVFTGNSTSATMFAGTDVSIVLGSPGRLTISFPNNADETSFNGIAPQNATSTITGDHSFRATKVVAGDNITLTEPVSGSGIVTIAGTATPEVNPNVPDFEETTNGNYILTRTGGEGATASYIREYDRTPPPGAGDFSYINSTRTLIISNTSSLATADPVNVVVGGTIAFNAAGADVFVGTIESVTEGVNNDEIVFTTTPATNPFTVGGGAEYTITFTPAASSTDWETLPTPTPTTFDSITGFTASEDVSSYGQWDGSDFQPRNITQVEHDLSVHNSEIVLGNQDYAFTVGDFGNYRYFNYRTDSGSELNTISDALNFNGLTSTAATQRQSGSLAEYIRGRANLGFNVHQGVTGQNLLSGNSVLEDITFLHVGAGLTGSHPRLAMLWRYDGANSDAIDPLNTLGNDPSGRRLFDTNAVLVVVGSTVQYITSDGTLSAATANYVIRPRLVTEGNAPVGSLINLPGSIDNAHSQLDNFNDGDMGAGANGAVRFIFEFDILAVWMSDDTLTDLSGLSTQTANNRITLPNLRPLNSLGSFRLINELSGSNRLDYFNLPSVEAPGPLANPAIQYVNSEGVVGFASPDSTAEADYDIRFTPRVAPMPGGRQHNIIRTLGTSLFPTQGGIGVNAAAIAIHNLNAAGTDQSTLIPDIVTGVAGGIVLTNTADATDTHSFTVSAVNNAGTTDLVSVTPNPTTVLVANTEYQISFGTTLVGTVEVPANFSLVQSSRVSANPGGSGNTDLGSISIGGVDYDIPTGGGGGATAIGQLTDVPSAFGTAGQVLKVNTAANALVYADDETGAGAGARIFQAPLITRGWSDTNTAAAWTISSANNISVGGQSNAFTVGGVYRLTVAGGVDSIQTVNVAPNYRWMYFLSVSAGGVIYDTARSYLRVSSGSGNIWSGGAINDSRLITATTAGALTVTLTSENQLNPDAQNTNNFSLGAMRIQVERLS